MFDFYKFCPCSGCFRRSFFVPQNWTSEFWEGLHEIDLDEICRMMVFLCNFEPWGPISCPFSIFWGRGTTEPVRPFSPRSVNRFHFLMYFIITIFQKPSYGAVRCYFPPYASEDDWATGLQRWWWWYMHENSVAKCLRWKWLHRVACS